MSVLPITDLPREIRTKSLVLRPIEITDAEVIYQLYAQDPDVARFMSWPLARKFDDTFTFVKSAVECWKNGTGNFDFVYAVCLANSRELIGCCSAGPHKGARFHWGVGYNFAKKFWGRGYATEAITALVRVVLNRHEVFRASAVVDLENPASVRVLEKAGFTREGILKRHSIHPNMGSEPRDIYLYAKTK